MEKAVFYLEDDNTPQSFYLLMDTVFNENTYVLASETDPDEEEAVCFILKKTGENEDDAVYEPVEDDLEYSSVSDIFKELLDQEEIDLLEESEE